jgi:Rhs element Vgr protein
MSTTLTDQIFAALAEFSSASRLYELKIGDREETGLLVEAFLAVDAVQEVGTRDVIALSTDAYLELDQLLGQPAVLEVCLADGGRERFAGEVCEAAMLGSDGGLARYRLRMSSWLWRLAHVRNSRVWQDKSVVEIVDAVFEAYLPLARWRWSEDTGPFLDEISPRSYCCQYRESDLDFVRRLLAEEGLCWRHEQTQDGAGLVLFADSSQRCAVPEDVSSEFLGGIWFHGARSVEESDSIQALSAERRMHASLTTVLSYDYKAKQAVAASSPSRYTCGSKLPVLESFDVPGQYAFADRQQAQQFADVRMQEQEARGQMWRGRSTVRTLRAGTRMQVLGAPLQRFEESASFTVLRVVSIGVNNMPPAAKHALAELFGPIPELLQDISLVEVPEDLSPAIEQARETGYANGFAAVSADIIWRPEWSGNDSGGYPKPVAYGAQSAIVVGADGSDQPNGADELYCDRLGRIRIRFHWQDSGNAICWVRVAQRSAGGGMGQQFLPRIGQEVLVQFLENDIDRPIIVGALYNGRGEGGIAATPGGSRDGETDLTCFEAAHDHASSAQANLSNGNSPLWHRASSDSAGHRNTGSQHGIRRKEFGAYGYSQLLFDDVNTQGRIQFRSTAATTELNLGHLIQTADNYRGSCRGTGVELRTDAYGTVRAALGLMVSSYTTSHNALERNSVGDNAAGISLLKQMKVSLKTFGSAAVTHQTVDFATLHGSINANGNIVDSKTSPIDTLLESLSGTINLDSFNHSTTKGVGEGVAAGSDKIFYSTSPIAAISASDNYAMTAGKNVHFSGNEATIVACGKDACFSFGGSARVHTRQAYALLGGAIRPDASGHGLELISTGSSVDLSAQGDNLFVQARDNIEVMSVSEHIDWASYKSLEISTAGGATIIIKDGNIKVQCPGKIAILAGKKKLDQPAKISYPFPALPTSICVECLIKARSVGSPFVVRSA